MTVAPEFELLETEQAKLCKPSQIIKKKFCTNVKTNFQEEKMGTKPNMGVTRYKGEQSVYTFNHCIKEDIWAGATQHGRVSNSALS